MDSALSPPVPTQAVQYADDAVEVTYSDGSQLALSPCGAAFQHTKPIGRDQHPLTETTKVVQRCRFATSEFREKVLWALDLRNRFAERPYLCADLIPREEILTLYSDVTHVRWPSQAEECEFLYLPCGSIELESEDGYATLTLAPHGQTFSVKCIAKISTDTAQASTTRKGPRSLGERNSTVDNTKTTGQVEHDGSYRDANEQQNILKKHHVGGQTTSSGPAIPTCGQKESLVTSGQQDSHALNHYSGVLKETQESLTTNLKDAAGSSGQRNSRAINQHSGVLKETKESLITNLKETAGTDVACSSDVSGSRQYCVWLTQYHSVLACPKAWTAPLALLMQGKNNQKTEIQNEESINNQCGSERKENPSSKHEISKDYDILYEKSEGAKKKIESEKVTSSFPKGGILKKASKTMESDCSSENTKPPQDYLSGGSGPVLSMLPTATPLTCKRQHRHSWRIKQGTRKYADRGNYGIDGRIKVLFAQGVVYRVHQSRHKLVEIHPGDGSVIISEGLSGHIFKHFAVDHGEVEVRCYTVKALPPAIPGERYSLAKLIPVAAMLLKTLLEDDLHLQTQNEARPCWQQEEDAPLRPDELPPPTALLEQTTVPELGRFSAHSNGHVRIVFNDRTCLDVQADFTQRLDHCKQHSPPRAQQLSDRLKKKSESSSDLKAGQCRILDTNGQYILVSLTQPQSHHRYIQLTKEWIDWVKAPPGERRAFYQEKYTDNQKLRDIAAELSKIRCFNYILDHTHPLRPNTASSPASLQKPTEVLGRDLASNYSDPSTHMANYDMVAKALSQTSAAISDIDNLLSANGELKPTRLA